MNILPELKRFEKRFDEEMSSFPYTPISDTEVQLSKFELSEFDPRDGSDLLSDSYSIAGGDHKERQWAEKKKSSRRVADLFKSIGRGSKASRVKQCADLLIFQGCPTSDQHPKRLTNAGFC